MRNRAIHRAEQGQSLAVPLMDDEVSPSLQVTVLMSRRIVYGKIFPIIGKGSFKKTHIKSSFPEA